MKYQRILVCISLMHLLSNYAYGEELNKNISIQKRTIFNISIDSLRMSNLNNIVPAQNIKLKYYVLSIHGPQVFELEDSLDQISFMFYVKDSSLYSIHTSNPNCIVENKILLKNLTVKALIDIYGPPNEINDYGIHYEKFKARFSLNIDSTITSIEMMK